ncbi:hypothetical protein AC249_AIPGENE24629, partial [Exaiptasia diaphana]
IISLRRLKREYRNGKRKCTGNAEFYAVGRPEARFRARGPLGLHDRCGGDARSVALAPRGRRHGTDGQFGGREWSRGTPRFPNRSRDADPFLVDLVPALYYRNPGDSTPCGRLRGQSPFPAGDGGRGRRHPKGERVFGRLRAGALRSRLESGPQLRYPEIAGNPPRGSRAFGGQLHRRRQLG